MVLFSEAILKSVYTLLEVLRDTFPSSKKGKFTTTSASIGKIQDCECKHEKGVKL